MKVLHYSSRLGRSAGGLYYSVSGLARAMAGLGADVTVAGGREKHFEEERRVWDGVDLATHKLDRTRYGLSARMLAEIDRIKPDILHIHGIWSAGSIYGRLAPKRARVVVPPPGIPDPWILQRKPWLKRPHAALFERPMLARAHIHALSEHEAGSIESYMPALRGRIFTLPNGTEPSASAEKSEQSGVLYLGRLHEKKQVLPLAEAWAQHAKRLTLTIAGWGDQDTEAQVARLCAQAKRVRFIGALAGEEKRRAFAAARFFVLPSLSEGLPMAALEAISHGCIPVLTDACHLPQLFRDDVALRMEMDFSDFGAVVQRIEKMTEGERALRSARALEAARQFFWPEIARKMLDHYAGILGESRP